MPSFLGELKRRKVFQVAAVYAVVAWLLVQIVVAVQVPLGLPAWFATAVIVLLAVGFPIAVILGWAFDLTPQGLKAASQTAPHESVPPPGQRLNYITHALVLLAVGFLVVDQYVLEPHQSADGPALSARMLGDEMPGTVQRAYIDLGATESLPNGLGAAIALSEDGTSLVYMVRREGVNTLYLRPMDSLESTPIQGARAPRNPFVSPDGEWIGYTSGYGRLERVPTRGGAPQVLAQTGAGFLFTGAWDSQDSVVFSEFGASGWVIARMSANGGEAHVVTTEPAAGSQHLHPHPLPNAGLLFSVRSNSGQRFAVAAFSPGLDGYRTIVDEGYDAQFVPTGHVVFGRSGTLWAVPFDADRLEVTGEAVPVVDGVQTDSESGLAVYAVSASNGGTLVYLPGADTSNRADRTPVWVDRNGHEEPTGIPPGAYRDPRLSPDGRLLAMTVADSEQTDIWIYDVETGSPTRLTFDSGNEASPRWSPEGDRVLFWSDRDGGGLFAKRADGSGQAVQLTRSALGQSPDALTRDGRELVITQEVQGTQSDLYVVDLESDAEPRPLLATDWDEDFAALSPNGRWLAYEDNLNSATPHVVIRRYPAVADGQWQVAVAGSAAPIWRADGKELFFWDIATRSAVMSVTFDGTGATPEIGSPQSVFNNNAYSWDKWGFDVAPNGQRFLMLKYPERAAAQAQTHLVVVTNWFKELTRQAPRRDGQ